MALLLLQKIHYCFEVVYQHELCSMTTFPNLVLGEGAAPLWANNGPLLRRLRQIFS